MPAKRSRETEPLSKRPKLSTGSAELRTVVKCRTELERAIVALESKFVHFLELEGFLPKTVHDEILKPETLLTDDQKVVKVVYWIRHRVEGDKQSFHLLVDWFKKQGKFYQPIVRTLETEYKQQVAAQSTQCQCTDVRCDQPSQPEVLYQSLVQMSPMIFIDQVITQLGWAIRQLRIVYTNLVTHAVSLLENMQIRRRYSDMLRNIANNLMRENVDNVKFRAYVSDLFGTDSVSHANTVNDVFEVLSTDWHWSYLDVTCLEMVAIEFSQQSINENMGMLSQYKVNLKNYKATTRLSQHMAILENEAMGIRGHHPTLSVAVEGPKYHEASLLFIDQIWDGIVNACRGALGSTVMYKKVLYKICLQPRDNVIIIEWFINGNLLKAVSSIEKVFHRRDDDTTDRQGHKMEIYGHFRSFRLGYNFIYNNNSGTVQRRKSGQDSKQNSKTAHTDEDERIGFMIILQHEYSSLEAISRKHATKKYLGDLMAAAKSGSMQHKTSIDFDVRGVPTKTFQLAVSSFRKPRGAHFDDASACVVTEDNKGQMHPLSESHDLTLSAKMISAARRGDLPLVKKLLEDPNVKEEDNYGWTCLLWACHQGHTDVVEYLLDYGADVDTQDSEGWCGLILSCRRGYLDIVKNLLDKSANVNQLTNTRWSALMWTAQEGYTAVLQLLDRGVNLTIQDKAGFTPLLQASQDGHLGVVEALVEHDPEMDMDQCNNGGWSAVMVATKNGHEDIVRYLVERGSNVHYQKEDEVTALHIAGFKGHNSLVRYFCLSERMIVDIQDKDGVTPLMFAVKQGRLDVAFQWTALFCAVNERRPMVLDYLLRTGRPNVKHVDGLGHTIVDVANQVNPDALECLSKYHKAETETMTRATPIQFTMNAYQIMLDRISNKINVNVKASAAKEVPVGAA